MGVPVVTLTGEAHVSRVGASLLGRVGLEECAAGSDEQYIARAVSWAGRESELAVLRQQLRARLRASSLMDEPGFARRMEAAYAAMWRRFREAAPPAAIHV